MTKDTRERKGGSHGLAVGRCRTLRSRPRQARTHGGQDSREGAGIIRQMAGAMAAPPIMPHLLLATILALMAWGHGDQ